MRARFTKPLVTVALAAASVAMVATAAWAGSGPGTPAQVTADVAASLSVQVVPANLSPSLSAASHDTAYVDTPSLSTCNVTTTTLNPSKCVFGDTKGTHTMVLWGDSHAFMWFPAVNAVAKAAKWKLVALMEFGCPVASVSVWNPVTKTPYKVCDSFRKNMITAINKLNPSLVILTEAFTSQAATGGGASNTITTTQWQAGLAKTLRALHSTRMKRLILGNTISSSSSALAVPASCLAAHPTQVQMCTASDTPAQQAQRASEVSAAASAKTFYVNVLPWLCSSKANPMGCSSIIEDGSNGNKVTYYSTGHLTRTYALYLTTVLQNALKPHMK